MLLLLGWTYIKVVSGKEERAKRRAVIKRTANIDESDKWRRQEKQTNQQTNPKKGTADKSKQINTNRQIQRKEHTNKPRNIKEQK